MIRKYQNGNVTVTIDDETGWKERFTEDDEFYPAFAECCDVHISDRCDNECPFCYAGCSKNGNYGRLFGWKFLETLHPYTEMAINLQMPVSEELHAFLYNMKQKKIIVNATVNQKHFMNNEFRELINMWQELGFIHGIGISMNEPTDEFIKAVQSTPNSIVHVINGIVTVEQLEKLANKEISVLILGYKTVGRGAEFYSVNTVINESKLYFGLGAIINNNWFKHVCFDNLALHQLDPKRFLSEEQWELSYQGDDGTSTFFINLVDGTFGKNSLASKEERISIDDRSIDEMFNMIRVFNIVRTN